MMWAKELRERRFFYLSLALHGFIFAALVLSITLQSSMPVLENSDQRSQIINAMVIDAAPMQPHKIIPAKPKPTPIVQPKQVEPKPVPMKPNPVILKKQAIAILPKKEKPVEQNKIAEQLLKDIAKQKQQQKKVKQKSIEKEFQKELKELDAKSLQQQMLQAQKQLDGARHQAMRGIVDKYKAMILQAIGQNWLVPSTVDKSLSAELLIRLAPGGTVLDVQVIKSSGDVSLDQSAEAAVFKASPLPVPTKSDEFDAFRQFVLKVKPENILNSG